MISWRKRVILNENAYKKKKVSIVFWKKKKNTKTLYKIPSIWPCILKKKIYSILKLQLTEYFARFIHQKNVFSHYNLSQKHISQFIKIHVLKTQHLNFIGFLLNALFLFQIVDLFFERILSKTFLFCLCVIVVV